MSTMTYWTIYADLRDYEPSVEPRIVNVAKETAKVRIAYWLRHRKVLRTELEAWEEWRQHCWNLLGEAHTRLERARTKISQLRA